jgi:hypothetical protein
MWTKVQARAFFALTALSFACAAEAGCVADRPSRNGVFNENSYVRKDFLIRPGDSDKPDRGWLMKATIVDASEPNVYGESSVFGLYAGSHSNGDIIHFVVSPDHLEMLNSREISGEPAPNGKTAPVGRQPEIINSWPVTNVDLKYRINLDGEKTNFYEENQELDWQSRQWVKINFAKNDLADLAPLGSYFNANVAKCADLANATATLIPDSFTVDDKNDYMEWSVQIALPIKYDDDDCMESYGTMGKDAQRIGRTTETVTLKYSFMRAADTPTYAPMVIAEKDLIRHKYGPITYTSWNRDLNTQLLTASEYVVRFDPQKPIVWYFEQGFPDKYKPYFTSNNLPAGVSPLPDGIPTIEKATNDLLTTSGVPARVSFAEWNSAPDGSQQAGTKCGQPGMRCFGDVRYNMVRFVQTLDQQSTFAGVTSPVVDPRTGENISTDIVFDNFTIKDYYVARIDAYLKTIGAAPKNTDGTVGIFASSADWAPPVDDKGQPVACTAGASVPIAPAAVLSNHNGLSTLYGKIQQYLYKPVSSFGPLGPQDFIKKQDDDFRRAYFAYIPYLVFGDPALNQFVNPEGGQGTRSSAASRVWQMMSAERQFHSVSADLEQGHMPYDPNSKTRSSDAFQFLDQYKALSLNHRDLRYSKQAMRFSLGSGHSLTSTDAITDFSIESVMQKDARHCIKGADGSLHWESKQEWIDNLISTYWSQVFWHEFGHAMGLGHNFMASVDQPNFPVSGKNADGSTKYALYASSVMEYNAVPDRVFWGAGWAPYDQGAIAWIYGNPSGKPSTTPPQNATPQGISGQVSASYPWNDPKGFKADGSEIQFLFCDERHTRYTPLCRAGDLGTTPSEITANEIEMYEWQYQWRNFRQYRKVWDDSAYADGPMNFLTELRRFISLWAFDMSPSEITQALQRIGVKPPSTAPSAQFYYAQLTEKFTDEMSYASALAAATHEAIVQQSSGQRPYVTIYDAFFSDVTQQGIALDKYDAIQSFTALWPIDNYDLNQSTGAYIASFSPFGFASEINGTGIGALFQTVTESAVNSMIGGSYDAFAFYKEDAVAQFAYDTHSVNFINQVAGASRPEVRDWLGGFIFSRLDDFLGYFRDIAHQVGFVDPVNKLDCSPSPGPGTNCNYDPRTPRAYQDDLLYSDVYNEFLGPDGRRYIWVYVPDRNQWVVADRDRNTATYTILRNYTTDVILQKDDGNYGGPAFNLQTQVKYFIDYFTQTNSQPH